MSFKQLSYLNVYCCCYFLCVFPLATWHFPLLSLCCSNSINLELVVTPGYIDLHSIYPHFHPPQRPFHSIFTAPWQIWEALHLTLFGTLHWMPESRLDARGTIIWGKRCFRVVSLVKCFAERSSIYKWVQMPVASSVAAGFIVKEYVASQQQHQQKSKYSSHGNSFNSIPLKVAKTLHSCAKIIAFSLFQALSLSFSVCLSFICFLFL